MCDLWVHTLESGTPPGAIPEQIRAALADLPAAQRLKLYNAGSFFDPRAVPPSDHRAVAALGAPFERVVVESHPALVGDSCFAFQDLLGGRLEVAMGLETAHPEVLARLNKGMTLEDFRRAAGALGARGIALRAFLLVGLPFLPRQDERAWTLASAAFAFDCGASTVSLIPTRSGNGALDALAATGDFAAPDLATLEDCAGDALALGRGRVFADLWDLSGLARCPACFDARRSRLARQNLEQRPQPEVACPACGGSA